MEEFPDRSKEVCTEMLKARGYQIDKGDASCANIRTNLSIKEDIPVDIIGVKDKDVIWVFLTQTPLNIQLIKKYVEILVYKKIYHAILIYNSITNQAKKVVETPQSTRIELFSRDEMQFNITEHELVPKHIKLSPEEVAKLRKELRSPNQELKIPTMLTTDVVARFYGYTEGDCIKIIRNGGYVTYRIVKKP